MIPLVVVGAGGFGRETIDVILAINEVEPAFDLLGVVDDSPSDLNRSRLEAIEVPLLGRIDELKRIDCQATIGVGSPKARQAISTRLDEYRITSPILLHPTAVIGSAFQAQSGLVVCAGVTIGTNVVLGSHVHLNPHAVVGHDTIIENFVSVNPNATVSGDCVIGQGTLLGAASIVLEGRTLPPATTVGAAACVVDPGRPGETVVGVPARSLKRTSDQ